MDVVAAHLVWGGWVNWDAAAKKLESSWVRLSCSFCFFFPTRRGKVHLVF